MSFDQFNKARGPAWRVRGCVALSSPASMFANVPAAAFSWIVVAVKVLVLASLTACTPTLDWRISTLTSHGHTYRVTFPGKPVSAQKTVQLDGAWHSLTLHAVQADSAQFALGHVAASSAAQAQALALALAKAFAANLGGELKRNPAIVGNTVGAFDVVYPSSASRYAQARFMWTQTAAYELLTVGKPADLTAESADTFIRSMNFE